MSDAVITAEIQLIPEPTSTSQRRMDHAVKRLKPIDVAAVSRDWDDRLKGLGRFLPGGAASKLGTIGSVVKDLGKLAPSVPALAAAASAALVVGAAAGGVYMFSRALVSSGQAAEEAAKKIMSSFGGGLSTSDVELGRGVAKYLTNLSASMSASQSRSITAFGRLGAVSNLAARSDLAVAASAVSTATSIGVEDITSSIAEALSGGEVRGVVKQALKGREATVENITSGLNALAKSTSGMQTYAGVSEKWASRFASLGRRFFAPVEKPLFRFLGVLDQAWVRLEPVVGAMASLGGDILGGFVIGLVDVTLWLGQLTNRIISIITPLMDMQAMLEGAARFGGRALGFGGGFLASGGNPLAAVAGGELGGELGVRLLGGVQVRIVDEIAAMRASIDKSREEAKTARSEANKPIRVVMDTKIQWGDTRSLQVAVEDVLSSVAQQAAQRARTSRRALPVGG
jgi:hypothetical protein